MNHLEYFLNFTDSVSREEFTGRKFFFFSLVIKYKPSSADNIGFL